MSRRSLKRWVTAALVVCALSSTRSLRADAEADRLFQDARTAMSEKRFDAACALFELSLSRDPADGTRVNLGLCEAARGRLLKAKELLTTADKNLVERQIAPEDERRALIQRELAEVERRMPRLVVQTEPKGAAVELDGKPLSPTSLGLPIPIDPGPHTASLIHSAGRVDQPVSGREGEVTTVRLLGPASVKPAPAPEGSSSPHPSVWVVGSFAIAALAAGIVTGSLGMLEKADVDQYCEQPFPGQDKCTTQAGVDAAARGRTFAIASTASFAGAGLLTGVTIGLWLGIDDGAGPTTSMLRAGGRF